MKMFLVDQDLRNIFRLLGLEKPTKVKVVWCYNSKVRNTFHGV